VYNGAWSSGNGKLFAGIANSNGGIFCINTLTNALIWVCDIGDTTYGLERGSVGKLMPLDMAVSDDGNWLYVITNHPQKLLKIDVGLGSVVQENELLYSSAPRNIYVDSIGQYNGLIVVFEYGNVRIYEQDNIETIIYEYNQSTAVKAVTAYSNSRNELLLVKKANNQLQVLSYDEVQGYIELVSDVSIATSSSPHQVVYYDGNHCVVPCRDSGVVDFIDLDTYSKSVCTGLIDVISAISCYGKVIMFNWTENTNNEPCSEVLQLDPYANTSTSITLDGCMPVKLVPGYDGDYVYILDRGNYGRVEDGDETYVKFDQGHLWTYSISQNLVVETNNISGGSAAGKECMTNQKLFIMDAGRPRINVYSMP